MTKPLGIYMTKVFARERTWFDPVLRPLEKLIYRLTAVDEGPEIRWTEYTIAMLLFSGVSMLLLYVILRLQSHLPWFFAKYHTTPMTPELAFSTAASFTTNTNWQFYSGESIMSYFSQMAGLAYHNFISAAVGIALAVALIRGIARREKDTIIKKEQAEGKLVAMTGDGTNDAPALAQSDVGVAMNSGTQAGKEAGNMVDLDSNPTKPLEIVGGDIFRVFFLSANLPRPGSRPLKLLMLASHRRISPTRRTYTASTSTKSWILRRVFAKNPEHFSFRTQDQRWFSISNAYQFHQ